MLLPDRPSCLVTLLPRIIVPFTVKGMSYAFNGNAVALVIRDMATTLGRVYASQSKILRRR